MISDSSQPSDASDDIDLENSKLSDLFDRGWKMQRELRKASDESSESFTTSRKKAIKILEKCEFMLDELHLFSDNESLDEVSTSEIRYFLIYALLGWLYYKVNSNKPEIRLVDLELAKHYFLKYLSLTKSYELHKFSVSKLNNEDDSEKKPKFEMSDKDRQAAFDANLTNMAYERSEKIRRYKEQKELEKQLEAMSLVLTLKPEQVDEEQRRKAYETFVKYWINVSIDELKVLIDEINILQSIELEKAGRQSEGASSKYKPAAVDAKPKKPFIITKDALQAKVFGAGYPSLPVYSVEEFYDQLADKGMMPQAGCGGPRPNNEPVQIGGGVTDTQKEQDKAEKDRLDDLHDEQELLKQREWDEFKDENKRGSGNRFNRS